MTTVTTNILGSLNLGKRALVAHQTALNTIGHNLANLSTPGYTRQRADLASVPGNGGVDVQDIQRVRDRFLDFSLLNEQQTLGKSQAQESLMQRLQSIFNDSPGTGLSATLDGLFQGFQDLAANPTDLAVRASVVDQANRVAATFQGLRGRVDQLRGDLTTEIQQDVTKANGLLSQIADLHRQIIASRGGPVPNDLLDRRDQLVTQLAQIVGVTPTDRPDGTVQLAMTGTGVLLVDGTDTAPLSAAYDSTTDTVNLTAGAATLAVAPRSGALAAVMDARNSATGPVKQARADLDMLASTLAAAINRVQASGTGLTEYTSLTAANAVTSSAAALTGAGLPTAPVTGSFKVIVHDATGAVLSTVNVGVTAGTTTLADVAAAIDADPNLTATVTGGKLTIGAAAGTTFAFAGDSSDTLMALGLNTFFVGSDAASLAVNPVLAADPNKLAAARADSAGLVHPGDGTNALALAGLSKAFTMNGGTATFTDFYAGTVGRVGAQAKDAIAGLDRQQATVQVVQSMQQQTSGVSSDEELVSLSQAQTAYAAAAKFITTVNTMIDTLLTMVGQTTP